MFKIRSLGLFQPSYTGIWTFVFYVLCPGLNLGLNPHGNLWNTEQHCLYCVVCCLLRPRAGLCSQGIITLQCEGIYTLHTSQGLLRLSVCPADCQNAFNPLTTCFEGSGQGNNPREGKELFQFTVILQNANAFNV